jgi:Icc-related predicted phosphoesterase
MDGERLKDFSFEDSKLDESIQSDLEQSIFTAHPESTIYVFHTPANNTALDITENEKHVGSFAVRQFIEKHQPFLTLHGHIHETVDMSGKYQEKIGISLGMSAGNHNYDSNLAVLVFDTEDPSKAIRKKLPCTYLGKLRRKILRF